MPNVPYSNFFYDQQDEIEAHNRGELFGINFSGELSDEYSSLPTGLYDYRNIGLTNNLLNSPRKEQSLNQIANNLWTAFRVDNKTYYKKLKK